MPSGQPSVIAPDMTKTDFEKLQQALPKFQLHFEEATNKWWMLPLLTPLGAKKRRLSNSFSTSSSLGGPPQVGREGGNGGGGNNISKYKQNCRPFLFRLFQA